MKIKYELNEKEIREAIADYLRDNKQAYLMYDDVVVTVHEIFEDRGGSRGFKVTATATSDTDHQTT